MNQPPTRPAPDTQPEPAPTPERDNRSNSRRSPSHTTSGGAHTLIPPPHQPRNQTHDIPLGPEVGDGQSDDAVVELDASVAGVKDDSDNEIRSDGVQALTKNSHRLGIGGSGDRGGLDFHWT